MLLFSSSEPDGHNTSEAGATRYTLVAGPDKKSLILSAFGVAGVTFVTSVNPKVKIKATTPKVKKILNIDNFLLEIFMTHWLEIKQKRMLCNGIDSYAAYPPQA